MRISIFFLLLIVFKSVTVVGQPGKKVNDYLQQVYRQHVMPGFSVVILKDGKTFFEKGFGYEVSGKEKPFTAATVVGIGSVTKSFTSLAIMQLVDEGKIELDKPIVFYLPWFRTANKEKSDKISVRMLLNHTSGLFGTATNSNDMSDKSVEGLARALQSVYLTREPGISYEYSNLGYSIAGLIVNRVSGIPYVQYMQEKIFAPMNMQHTTTDHNMFEKIQTIYGHYPGTKNAIPAKRIIELESGEYISAGSLTKSCATDLEKYMMMLLNGGSLNGRRIVSEKSMNAMWAKNISFPGLKKEQGGEGKNSAYGLGWEISTMEGRELIYHGGSTGTSSAVVMLDTAKKIGIAIVINIDMTLIDEYRYQTLLNIMNNVMHIAAGEPITNYGIPRIKDPSANNYDLEKSLYSKYEGNYTTLSGANWMFDGADMTIRENANGQPEAIINRGQQVIYQFDLDFVNRSSAITRNIFMSSQIHFKVAPDGSVSGLFFNGAEYLRQNNFLQEKFRTIKSKDETTQFRLPLEWQVEWNGSYFSAHSIGHPEFLLKGYVSNNNDSLSGPRFTNDLINQYIVRYNGTLQSETVGQLVWKEKTMISEKNGRLWQQITLSVKSGNHSCYVVFIAPREEFTESLQKLVSPLVMSFRFG